MGYNENQPKGLIMPERKRIKLEVYVDLDPVPGTFHTKEGAGSIVAQILQQQIPHYNPAVSITIE